MLSTWGQGVLLLLVAIGVYFQTWVEIWPYWENKNATYTHGTLVAAVSAWLVWRARSTVNQFEPMPSARAVPVLLMLSALWVLAETANVFIVYAALWPVLAFAVLWVGLGLRAASHFAFPLSFLYFAIPLWDYLKPPLQAISSTMVGLLTGILGIPAAIDGHYVTLPTATIHIAQDCSGAHFLCVALAVGVLAGVLRGDDRRTRLLILVVAGLLSMIFNWLRILLIVLAYLHPGLREGFEAINHVTFGWWVFALDLVVFSLVLRLIPRSARKDEQSSGDVPTASTRRNNRAGLSMATLVAVLIPAVAWTLPRFDTYPNEIVNADLGVAASGAELVSPDLRWGPHYPGAVREDRFAIMTDGGIAVEVYRNQYHEQTQGSELISRGSYLFDPSYFSPDSSTTYSLQQSSGESIPVRHDYWTDSAGTTWLSVYTYFVESKPMANSRRVQLSTALRSMYSRTAAGVLAVAAPCASECDSRVSELEDTFVRVLESYRVDFSD